MHVAIPGILFIILQITNQAFPAKILFFYAGATYSHKNNIWPLVTALADRGHNVTLLSPFSRQPTAHSLVNDLAPKFLQNAMENVLETDKLQDRQNGVENEIWSRIPAIGPRFCKLIAENSKTDPTLHTILYNNTFDLIVINAVFSECGIMWAHYKKTRFIISVSTSVFPWLYDVYGLPIESSWLPDLALQFNYPMAFYDRVKNYAWTLYFYYLRKTETYPAVERLMKETFDLATVPDFLDLEREASLVLMNTFQGTEFARALPPFFVQIGGMQCWLPKRPLPTDLQTYMDNAEDGVILVAFGSTIDFSKIPESFHDIFTQAMTAFPKIRFIWKWNGEQPKTKPENLLFVEWLPQMEILGHPKMLAFITHCGLNSVMEATYQGVPLIGLPLFGDQDYNAYHIRVHNMGVVLEARDLTMEEMQNAILEVVTNEILRKNALKISNIFKDRTLNPIEAGVFWTEYVLRNEDTSVLKPLNYQQPWWQRRLLDVSAFIILIASLCLTSLVLIATISYKVAIQFLRSPVQEAYTKIPSEKGEREGRKDGKKSQ